MLYFCRRYGCESFCAVRAGLGRYSVYVVADSLGERTGGGGGADGADSELYCSGSISLFEGGVAGAGGVCGDSGGAFSVFRDAIWEG